MLVKRLIIIMALLGLAQASAAQTTPPQTTAPQATQPSRFEGWTAAVIAADWRTSQGQPIQAFDNARRDLTSAFVAAGFRRSDLIDHTLRPDVARPVTARAALEAVQAKARTATKGCFLYLTSHGSPQGIVFGPDAVMSPQAMAMLVNGLCAERPTVVVVSACFSGVFIPALRAPNRMVLTAARPDRSSFGCSEEATYPYFDGCILKSLPKAADFLQLASLARTCVAERERAEGLTPPSEPQVFVGADMQLLLPTLRFTRPASARPGS